MQLQTFWDYREYFRESLQPKASRIAEPEGEYKARAEPLPLNERLIQAIWAQQLLSPTGLRLMDGRSLQVLDPGRWNGMAGPDFRHARLMIDGAAVGGDIEIHLDAAGWEHHGHQRDMDYNGVVLHVIWNAADGQDRDDLHNGQRAPRLELEPYVFPDIETLRRSMTADDFAYADASGFGRCQRLMSGIDTKNVAEYLDRAGDERLLSKTARLSQQAASEDLEQVFYQSMMLGLGGGGSAKTLYYLLAKRTPLAEMFDYVRDLDRADWTAGFEALLMHVGGLAPCAGEIPALPQPARERAERLAALWARFEPYWRDRVIPPTKRWLRGVRPVNFPTRRLAGMAVWLTRRLASEPMPLEEACDRLKASRQSLEDMKPSKKTHPAFRELAAWFAVKGVGATWGNLYSFTANPSSRTMDLIGAGAASSLTLNALLPAAMLAAQHHKDHELAAAAQACFAIAPPLQSNHITEFMTARLFGGDGRATIVNTERRRQGLFQIFYHCCNGEERHCESCYYFK